MLSLGTSANTDTVLLSEVILRYSDAFTSIWANWALVTGWYTPVISMMPEMPMTFFLSSNSVDDEEAARASKGTAAAMIAAAAVREYAINFPLICLLLPKGLCPELSCSDCHHYRISR